MSELAADWSTLEEIAAKKINPTSLLGAHIGPYQLVEVLGQGGMGVVFKAWQSAPFERHVALKFMLKAPESALMRAYFSREQRALALMNHPNVAVVHEAGFSPQVQPYFVMEFIDGVPLTRYCDANQLTIPERLELFSEICMGVQHAHGKGILHRDLKPGNVLVTKFDNRTVAKVIDFGVASFLSDGENDLTSGSTGGGGTPLYMSPEQIERPQDIDVRSDVYSLGVMLFELLTGTMPLHFADCKSQAEILARKRKCDFGTPSTRIQSWHRDPGLIAVNLAGLSPTLIEDLKAPAYTATNSAAFTAIQASSSKGGLFDRIADRRAANVGMLIRQCRGDVDWIVAKAMAADPARRYATPADLAADLRRHMRHEPVSVGPNTRAYRTRKFIRRNRTTVAGVVAVLAVSLVGTIVAGLGWRSAWLAQQDAVVQKARAEKQAGKREDYQYLVATSLGRFRGPDTRVSAVLEQTVTELDRLGSDLTPDIAAWTRSQLGEWFYLQGNYERSWEQLDAALTVLREQAKSGDPDAIADLRSTLARTAQVAYYHRSDLPLSRALAEEAAQLEGASEANRIAGTTHLGEFLFEAGDYEQADRLFAEAETRAKAIGADLLLRTIDNDRAYVLTAMGEPTLAEPRYRAVVTADRADPGVSDGDRAMSINNLGLCLLYQGKIEEGEQLVREAETLRRGYFGEEHAALANSWIAFGFLELVKGNLPGSESWYRKAVEFQSRVFGEPHLAVAFTRAALAGVLSEHGQDAAAEEMLQSSIATYRQLTGRVHPVVPLVYAYFRAMLHEQRGDAAGAELRFNETAAMLAGYGHGESVLHGNAVRGTARMAARSGKP